MVTGGVLSVSLANKADFYALRYVLERLSGFKRFLDDTMGLWTGIKEKFTSWADSVIHGLDDGVVYQRQ